MSSKGNIRDPIVLSIAGSDPSGGAGIQACSRHRIIDRNSTEPLANRR